MKNIVYAVLFSLLVFAGANGYATAPEAEVDGKYTISLYGNDFTIEPSYIKLVNGEGRPHTWQSVAYFVPEVMPGIRGDEDKRSVHATIDTITHMVVAYQKLADLNMKQLAERLEEEGHLGLLAANELDQGQVKFYNEVLAFAPKQRKINELDGAIHAWFRDGTWAERVAKYNETQPENALQPYSFLTAYTTYQYFLSLYYLDTLVRRSPEFNVFLAEYKANLKKEVTADPSP